MMKNFQGGTQKQQTAMKLLIHAVGYCRNMKLLLMWTTLTKRRLKKLSVCLILKRKLFGQKEGRIFISKNLKASRAAKKSAPWGLKWNISTSKTRKQQQSSKMENCG